MGLARAYLIFVVILLTFQNGFCEVKALNNVNQLAIKLPKVEIEQAIHLAYGALKKMVRFDGQVLQVSIRDNGKPDEQKYDYLIQARAVSAVAKYQRQFPKLADPELLKSLVQKLIGRSVVPVGRNGMAFQMNERDSKSDLPRFSFEGTGLGFIALMEADAVSPGILDSKIENGIVSYLLSCLNPNGSQKVDSAHNCPNDQNLPQPLIYPASSIYSLWLAFERSRNENVREAAHTALTFAVGENLRLTSHIPGNWLLMSIAKALQHTHTPTANSVLLYHEAREIVFAALASQIKDPLDTEWIGTFKLPFGRSVPSINANLQGLTEIYSKLNEKKEIMDRIREAYQSALRYLLNAQIKEGRFATLWHRTALFKQRGPFDGNRVQLSVDKDINQLTLGLRLRGRSYFSLYPIFLVKNEHTIESLVTLLNFYDRDLLR